MILSRGEIFDKYCQSDKVKRRSMAGEKIMPGSMERLVDKDILKSYGAVSTPARIADLMIGLAGIKNWLGLEVLEPGAGLCEFLARVRDRYPENNFTGIEINPEIFEIATSRHKSFQLLLSDFLLWDSGKKYDLVIGNPPYGIIGDQSHYPIHALKEKRQAYKAASSTWFGKYNIYGAFIEKSVALLKDRARLVFIVPATFMVLDDFKLLRKFLARSGKIKIYYLGPGIFAKRQVSTAILVLEKGGKGIELHDAVNQGDIIKCYTKDEYDGGMIRFESGPTREFEKGKIPLGQIFKIRFAARSPQFRDHPLTSLKPGPGLVPALTGRNLAPGRIDYQRCYSGYYFPLRAASDLRIFYGSAHIVVGHTKGGRVVAAVDDRCYPWREEMHIVPKVQGVALKPIVDYLNSEEVQRYMKSLYREITPHLTITQLKLLPIAGP